MPDIIIHNKLRNFSLLPVRFLDRQTVTRIKESFMSLLTYPVEIVKVVTLSWLSDGLWAVSYGVWQRPWRLDTGSPCLD